MTIPDVLMTILGLLSQHSEAISAAGFLLFFAGSGIAIVFSQVEHVRTLFVVGLICSALVVNVTGLSVAPLVHLHKYTEAPDQHQSHYEIRLVDSNGQEIRLDSRAMSPINDRVNALGRQMVQSHSERQRLETSALILSKSAEYRTQLTTGTFPPRMLSYPPQSVNYKWDASDLSAYDEFVTVRIYRVDIRYMEGSHMIADQESNFLLEVSPELREVREGDE